MMAAEGQRPVMVAQIAMLQAPHADNPEPPPVPRRKLRQKKHGIVR